MRLKMISAMAAALLLAACASDEPAATGDAGASGGTTDTGTTQGAVTPGSPEDFQQNVGDRVFFDTDRYDLSGDAQSQLQKQAAWLQQYPAVTVTVEGHADERGTREYNIALGARRAQSVRSYLASRGIDPSRMRTISYGKERPVAVCNDISCWSQNRRAVTVLNASS